MSSALTPIDPTLRALAEVFAAGEDCGPALADRLCELGYPALAWAHFWPGSPPCQPSSGRMLGRTDCSVIQAVLDGNAAGLDCREKLVSGFRGFLAYQAAQLRPRAGMVTADE